MRSAVFVCLLGSLPLVAACSAPTPVAEAPAVQPAPPVPAYVPVISLNEMMVSVVDANSHVIWGVEDAPPKTAEDWSRLEHAAVTLAAAGNLTMLSGNGPKDQQWVQQADWAKYSTAISEAGLAAMQAARAKDADGVRKSGDLLVMSCINCHREYKLDVPKIWSDHEGHQ